MICSGRTGGGDRARTISVSCFPLARAVAVDHAFPHVFFQGGCYAERHGAKSTFVNVFTHSSMCFHVSRQL